MTKTKSMGIKIRAEPCGNLQFTCQETIRKVRKRRSCKHRQAKGDLPRIIEVEKERQNCNSDRADRGWD